MDETIRAIDIDEGAKIRKAGNFTSINFAFLQFADYAVFHGRTGFCIGGAFRKNQASAFEHSVSAPVHPGPCVPFADGTHAPAEH